MPMPPHAPPRIPAPWQQGSLIPLTITGLTAQGEGIGHFQERVVFVPNTVPGDQIQARLLRIKPNYAHAQVEQLLEGSPQRVRPACIVADKCGGCQWQHVSYALQTQTKAQLVADALERIGKLDLPAPAPILAAEQIFHYRNKVTYPIQSQDGQTLRMGYYQAGSHQLINLNQCPVQDQRLDVFLKEIKQDLQQSGWSAYQEQHHKGSLRHLGLRIGRRTGEVLLTLVVNNTDLPDLELWVTTWMNRYPDLVGVCLNVNPDRTNAIFGAATHTLQGRSALREEFAGFSVWIDSTSFFQVNTEQAEALFLWIIDQLHLRGDETVIDAYCGIGTLTLPLAQRVKSVTGIESLPAAVHQAEHNARFNRLSNTQFYQGKVEEVLPTIPIADLVILDPPRKGCEATVLETLLRRSPQKMVYISCHPATLARDLQILLSSGMYRLQQWRAADFFPQTGHVEAVALLEKR